MAFLDIKAAYDSVPRGELWRRCELLGLDFLTLSCLRACFDHNSAQLVLSQKRSSPFGLPSGVLQGSVLSPLLYSIYLDPLVDQLRSGPALNLPHNDERINCLMYADDIALIASSPRELQRLLNIAESDSISRGYRFSPSKCVIVSSGHYRHSLYSDTISRQASFSYLGIVVKCSGIDCMAHVKARIAKAEISANFLQLAGAKFRNFPAYINIQLYAAFIRPGLEYGLPLLGGH
jgi:hypothetical protein